AQWLLLEKAEKILCSRRYAEVLTSASRAGIDEAAPEIGMGEGLGLRVRGAALGILARGFAAARLLQIRKRIPNRRQARMCAPPAAETFGKVRHFRLRGLRLLGGLFRKGQKLAPCRRLEPCFRLFQGGWRRQPLVEVELVELRHEKGGGGVVHLPQRGYYACGPELQ